MADEAILRVILEGSGGVGGRGAGNAPSPPNTTTPPQPPNPNPPSPPNLPPPPPNPTPTFPIPLPVFVTNWPPPTLPPPNQPLPPLNPTPPPPGPLTATAYDLQLLALKAANEEINRLRLKAAKENILHGPADVLPLDNKATTGDLLQQLANYLPGGLGNVVRTTVTAQKAASAPGASVGGSAEGLAAAGAAGMAVAAAGIFVVEGFKAVADASLSAAVAVEQFAAKLLSGSDDPAQLPQAIGDAISGLGDMVEGIGATVGVFGALTAGVGVAIAVFAGWTGVGLVVGVAVAAVGLFIGVIGLATIAVGVFGKHIGELFKVLAAFMHDMDQMVERYGGYNPEIAVAQSMADLRETLADMRRSREVGPDLVSFIKARSDLQQKYEDLKIQAINKLMPYIINGMENLGSLIDLTRGLMGPDGVASEDFWKSIYTAFFGPPGSFATLPVILNKIARDVEKPEDFGDFNFLDEIMDSTFSDNLGNED